MIEFKKFELDGVTIEYDDEIPSNEKFICEDIMGLLDKYRGNDDTGKYPDMSYMMPEKIRIVFISNVSSHPYDESKIIKVLQTFCNYFDGWFIVTQVQPTVYNIPDAQIIEKPLKIDNIASGYSITNHGDIYRKPYPSPIPVKVLDYGPAVALLLDNCDMCFFPVAYLMAKTFNTDYDSTKDTIWEDEFERQCNLFEKAGFVDINGYVQYEYSCAYIYNNSCGNLISILIDMDNIVKNNKKENEE